MASRAVGEHDDGLSRIVVREYRNLATMNFSRPTHERD